jgi:hypothetical protein
MTRASRTQRNDHAERVARKSASAGAQRIGTTPEHGTQEQINGSK